MKLYERNDEQDNIHSVLMWVLLFQPEEKGVEPCYEKNVALKHWENFMSVH